MIQGLYIGILFVILLVDVRERRVRNALALPATGLALLAGLLDGREAFLLTVSGALAGFLFFYGLYWLGRNLYGRSVLGFGDVKLAMLLGAMLGLQQVFPALVLGILLAGCSGMILLLTKRAGRHSTLPYGAFLAAAGILMLLGGAF